MTMKINSNVCIGFGDCLKICPEVFKRVGDSTIIAQILMNAEIEKACMKAEIMCPVGAIFITEEEALKI